MKKKSDKTEAEEATNSIPIDPSSSELPNVASSAEVPQVYQAIANVIGDLAKVGIAKESENRAQGFKFRSIDAFYNALAPLLAKHGLVIIPRVLTRAVTERVTQKGGVLFSVVLEIEYDFVAAKDGSHHTSRFYGEASDSGDKGTSKALSAGYKYAVMETFCVPVKGHIDDADAETPDPIKPRVAEPADRLPPDWNQSRGIDKKSNPPTKPPNVAPGASGQTKPQVEPENIAKAKPGPKDLSLQKIIDNLYEQLSGWKFPTGANTGKTLIDLGFQNAERYAQWVKETSEKHGREPLDYQQKAVDMFEVFKKYLEAVEQNEFDELARDK